MCASFKSISLEMRKRKGSKNQSEFRFCLPAKWQHWDQQLRSIFFSAVLSHQHGEWISFTTRIFVRHLTSSVLLFIYTHIPEDNPVYWQPYTHWHIKALDRWFHTTDLSNHSDFLQPTDTVHKTKTKIMHRNSNKVRVIERQRERESEEETAKKNAANWNHSSKSKPLETIQFKIPLAITDFTHTHTQNRRHHHIS